jgi:hypothetical protein
MGIRGVEVSVLDGGEWSASLPSHFTPRERAPGTHWIGGWLGPRAVRIIHKQNPIGKAQEFEQIMTISSVQYSGLNYKQIKVFFDEIESEYCDILY